MSTILNLLRHGTTAANLEKRFAGRTDEPLHADGAKQIQTVADGLRDARITAIYSGPLRRTRQTAEILHARLAAPVHVAAAFNEIAIPHWDGLSKTEIRARFGPEYPTWLARPADFHCPGCETLAMVRDRAVAGVTRILENHPGERVVLVSHLIVLRCLVLHYLGRELEDFRKLTINNGEVTRITFDQQGRATVTLADPPV